MQIVAFQEKKRHVKGGGLLYGGLSPQLGSLNLRVKEGKQSQTVYTFFWQTISILSNTKSKVDFCQCNVEIFYQNKSC